jgi:hypothetical protein
MRSICSLAILQASVLAFSPGGRPRRLAALFIISSLASWPNRNVLKRTAFGLIFRHRLCAASLCFCRVKALSASRLGVTEIKFGRTCVDSVWACIEIALPLALKARRARLALSPAAPGASRGFVGRKPSRCNFFRASSMECPFPHSSLGGLLAVTAQFHLAEDPSRCIFFFSTLRPGRHCCHGQELAQHFLIRLSG